MLYMLYSHPCQIAMFYCIRTSECNVIYSPIPQFHYYEYGNHFRAQQKRQWTAYSKFIYLQSNFFKYIPFSFVYFGCHNNRNMSAILLIQFFLIVLPTCVEFTCVAKSRLLSVSDREDSNGETLTSIRTLAFPPLQIFIGYFFKFK